MRTASLSDQLQVFKWRNTQAIINLSSSKKPVEWSEHQRWFTATLNDYSSVMYIAEYCGSPIGQVRFDDVLTHRACITIYLHADSVGKGYGSLLIPFACSCLKESFSHVEGVYAIIRSENSRSIKAFIKSGFRYPNESPIDTNAPLLTLVLDFE